MNETVLNKKEPEVIINENKVKKNKNIKMKKIKSKKESA